MANSLIVSYITKDFDEQVINLLGSGAAGFMPSDTVYGLSARALDERAVDKLHQIKLRDEGKPFIVLISNLDQLLKLGVDTAASEQLVDKYWPGALTIIFPALSTPSWLTKGLDSLAVRLPNNQKLAELIDRVGPIVSTSANESGQPTVNTIEEARQTFGDKLDFYVDVGEINNTQPSTIVKSLGDNLQILRQGAVIINEEEL